MVFSVSGRKSEPFPPGLVDDEEEEAAMVCSREWNENYRNGKLYIDVLIEAVWVCESTESTED